MEESGGHGDLLPGAHRLIRRLLADEGPYAGDLVSAGESVAVRCAAERVDDALVWSLSGTEHVAAPIDLVRRAEGVDVLLPWCVELVAAYLRRRDTSEEPLSTGEAVTLVVSVLRGLGEVLAETEQPEGEWWLTDQGRPVLVLRQGTDAVSSLLHVLAMIRENSTDRSLGRLVERLQEELRRPRAVMRGRKRWEDELFELAAPRALQGVGEPARAPGQQSRERERQNRSARRRGEAPPLVDPSGTSPVIRLRSRGARMRMMADGLRRRFVRHADEDGRSMPELRTERERVGVRGRDRDAETRQTRIRPRALLLAGTVAIVLGAGGMLWPSSAKDEATATEQHPPAADETALSTAKPTGSSRDGERRAVSFVAGEPSQSERENPSPGSEGGSGGDGESGDAVQAEGEEASGALSAPPETSDPLASVSELLAAFASCGETGSEPEPRIPAESCRGLAVRGADASTATVIDQYGDIAVVRLTPVDPERDADQILVLIWKDEWLVRDVYDVADQPFTQETVRLRGSLRNLQPRGGPSPRRGTGQRLRHR